MLVLEDRSASARSRTFGTFPKINDKMYKTVDAGAPC